MTDREAELQAWLTDLETQREVVTEQLRPLESRIRQIDEEIAAIRRLIDIRNQEASPTIALADEQVPDAELSPLQESIRACIASRVDKPVRLAEIKTWLTERGELALIPGKGSDANLVTHFMRGAPQIFAHVGHGRYALREWLLAALEDLFNEAEQPLSNPEIIEALSEHALSPYGTRSQEDLEGLLRDVPNVHHAQDGRWARGMHAPEEQAGDAD